MENESQKISVIIPVYNVKKYIKKCLESVISQTYENLEIIIVDDGSTDGCDLICDDYGKKDARVSVIHKKNGGLVSAWKKGLEESTCDFVVFIDSDDWVASKHIEKLAAEQRKTGADIVVTSTTKVFPNHNEASEFIIAAKYYDKQAIESEIIPIMLNAGDFQKRAIPISRWAKLLRKKLILSNLHYSSDEATFSEDLNIMFPVLLDMDSISLIGGDENTYFYRQNPESMLRSYDKNMLHSVDIVFKSLFQVCEDKDREKMKMQVYADYLSAAVQCYKNELTNPNGIAETRKNIATISHSEWFRYSVEIVNWKKYKRKLNVVIIWAMQHHGGIMSMIILQALRYLKMRRSDKQLLKAGTWIEEQV